MIILTAAAVHEGGHLLALRLCGIPVRELRLGALGAVLEIGSCSYAQEAVCAAAGPAANLLCALTCGFLPGRCDAFAGANLVLAGFNLLPLRPMDGGRALSAVLTLRRGPDFAGSVLRIFGTAAAGSAAAALAAVAAESRGNVWLLIAAAGLVSAAAKEWIPSIKFRRKRSFL